MTRGKGRSLGKSCPHLANRNGTSAPTKFEHLVTFYLRPAGAGEFFLGISMRTRWPRTQVAQKRRENMSS